MFILLPVKSDPCDVFVIEVLYKCLPDSVTVIEFDQVLVIGDDYECGVG